MPYTQKIDLSRLLAALSKALDLTSAGMIIHHQRVAIASLEVARALGLKRADKEDIFSSAMIHDIGVTTSKEKLALMEFQLKSYEGDGIRHALVGWERLRASPVLARYAEIVKHHHDRWDGETPSGLRKEEIPIGSRIIHVVDRLAVLINSDRFAIGQEKELIERIEKLSGTYFQPMLVDCLKDLIMKESFLLDITTEAMQGLIDDFTPAHNITLDTDALLTIAHVFAGIIDQKSPYTVKHSHNVTKVAVALAKKVGFSPKEVGMMEIAALLHDLGKLSVPDEILDKPGKLSPDEFNIMKGHTYFTYHILRMVDGFDTVSEWAAFHHEKLNGKGYPFHVNNESIPIGSRVMAVSDVFSALAEDRPYRKAFTNAEIISVIDKMAGQGELDSEVVGLLKEDIEDIRGLINKNV